MKRILLFAIAIVCGLAVMAQLKPAKMSSSLKNLRYLETPAIDMPSQFTQAGNPVANSKSALDDILGTSGTYDMQSNASHMDRIICWPDGKISAAWMKADDASYASRGTGYNYFDGSAWGAAPAARIETLKTGWPNLCKWNGNGEIVVAHNSTTQLVINTRAAKGTGSWTQTLGPNGPTYNGTQAKLLWPRAVTNGANNQNVHIICLTMPTANGGTAYKGMDGALIYYRSTDGGANWDKNGVDLPGVDSTHFLAMSGDDYSWIEPHGDTLAFLYGNVYDGTTLFKSFDNGNTWIQQSVLTNYYGATPSGTDIPRVYGCDGTMAGAMDKNGRFHVAIGRMSNYQDAAGSYWYPGTDGLVYWNSDMAPLDTAMMADIDSIYNHGLLIGYVASNQAGDSIVGFPYYKGGLSTYPSITIDANNDMYILWSSLTVGNPDPTPYNYRHVWGRKFFNCTAWSDMIDLHSDFLYIFQEFAFPEVATALKGTNLCLLTQTSAQPGSNVAAGTTGPAVPVHEVSFAYREVSSTLWTPNAVTSPAASKNYVGQNYPNPVKGTTTFMVNIDKPANVTVDVLNIMGQKVMTLDKGQVSGTQRFTIDCNQLTSGIYFYSVKINGESYTHKMIVE